MPLRVSDAIDPPSLKEVPENYLIFYSSLSDGRLWCPVHNNLSELDAAFELMCRSCHLGLCRRRFHCPEDLWYRWPRSADSLCWSKGRVRHTPVACVMPSLIPYCRWKTPNNPFRSEPWNIQSIPTIIKLRDVSEFPSFLGRRLNSVPDQNKETSRLVESEINGGLASFVQEE